MMNKDGSVKATQFEVAGIKYTETRPNYYYKNEDGKQKRISKAEYEQAWDAYIDNKDAEMDEWEREAEEEAKNRKEEQDKKDKETEKNFNKKAITKKAITKKATKPRRSKDVAFEMDTIEGNITLTAKQVDFIKRIPDTCFYDSGVESIIWTDVLADEIGGQFAGKPMTVGAMISTLREKGVVSIGFDRINGKKCKNMSFTEVGQVIAKKIGLK